VRTKCFCQRRVSVCPSLSHFEPSDYIQSSHQLSPRSVIGPAVDTMPDVHQLQVSKSRWTRRRNYQTQFDGLYSCFRGVSIHLPNAKLSAKMLLFVLHVGRETTIRSLHTSWPNLSPSDIRSSHRRCNMASLRHIVCCYGWRMYKGRRGRDRRRASSALRFPSHYHSNHYFTLPFT